MSRKILIIDDDPDIVELIKFTLKHTGYEVDAVYNGHDGLLKVNSMHPHLLILDINLPDLSGFDLLNTIRSQGTTCLLPILMLTAHSKIQDKIKGLKSGADDYLTKPFDPFELEARVEALISRSEKQMMASPLTHLPGSIIIEEEIKEIISKKKKFGVAYLDLDNFKAYNDIYGFQKGDEVIMMTARVIQDAVKQTGSENDLVGHIGGDDFIFISVPEKIEDICRCIISEFNTKIPGFYSEDDRKKKYIISYDRRGNKLVFPLMSVSIGIVTNEKREIKHFAKVAEVATEVKKVAKSVKGSSYFKDRRKE